MWPSRSWTAWALPGLEALGGQGSLSLVSPRVATPVGQFGTQVDAVAERVFRPAFTFNRLAGVLGADLVNGWFSMALQGELELDDVDTVGSNDLLRLSESYVDPERGRFPNGRFLLWATRLTATGRLPRRSRQHAFGGAGLDSPRS